MSGADGGRPALPSPSSASASIEPHHVSDMLSTGFPSWISRFTVRQRQNSIGSVDLDETQLPVVMVEDTAAPTASASVTIPRISNMLAVPGAEAPGRGLSRRNSLVPPDACNLQNIASPSESFLMTYWNSSQRKSRSDPAAGKDADDGMSGREFHITGPDDVSSSITEHVSKVIPMHNFPMMTQESMETLRKLKIQILESSESLDLKGKCTLAKTQLIDLHPDAGVPSQVSDMQHPPRPEERPVGRLASYLLNQPFAQNWFFRNAEAAVDSDVADDEETPHAHLQTSDPSDSAPPDEAVAVHGLADKVRLQQEKDKSSFRQMNLWSPQNL